MWHKKTTQIAHGLLESQEISILLSIQQDSTDHTHKSWHCGQQKRGMRIHTLGVDTCWEAVTYTSRVLGVLF